MKYQIQKRLRRLTGVIILVLFSLTIFTSTAEAQDFFYGTVVAAGETVANDVLLNGDNLLVDGTVDGDLFAFGRNVTINGSVSGSAFIIANQVEINGTISGSIYVIAVSTTLEESAQVDHSVYFIGLSFQNARGSQIDRDLNGISLSAVLRGSVGRHNNMVIGIYKIAELVFNWFNQLNTGKESSAALVLDEQAAFPIRIIPAAITISNTKTAAGIQTQVEVPSADDVNSWLNRYMRGLVSFLIVGGLAIWLWPRPFDSWAERVQTRPLSSFFWGVVAYIVGFAGTVLLMAVIVSLAAFFGYLSLWWLALTWLGLGLSGLGVGFWTFILFLAFMSKAIVAIVIGRWIFSKVYARANGRHLWPLLLGLIIYTLICMIPVLTWVFGFIVTCLGLGAVWQVIREQRRSEGGGEGGTAVSPTVSA